MKAEKLRKKRSRSAKAKTGTSNARSKQEEQRVSKASKNKIMSHATDELTDTIDLVSNDLEQLSESVKGFPGTADDNDDTEEANTRKLVAQQNRKNKKSGGFQAMGLSYPVYKGIFRKGYKIPTPIQRKTIPVITGGKDVVAMARTGSGKTAAFLIPMFERLKIHSGKTGARALVMAPTRELALQTLKFTKELGKFTGLQAVCILGGDKMDDQFAAMHANPDIIIATPGRFLHVIMEMDLKLSCVEYVVFDEADRLFEMGFAEQLQEIIHRLPEARQTLLFSATLPKLLVDFARAGLTDPVLIRLDVDTKLSDQLKLAFIGCREDDKVAVLLHLLRNVTKPTDQTLIFAATKHHVEYLSDILSKAGICCSYVYSSLDQTARKINIAKFENKKTMVMLVTDVAARGIDIPMLDNCINFNFPAKSKLFVHRVGRVARAGRTGNSYSLVTNDELSYMLDLHLYLGRPIKYAGSKILEEDGIYGLIPQNLIDEESEQLRTWHAQNSDLVNMKKVCANAMKQYIKSRPPASLESCKRVKQDLFSTKVGIHPLFTCPDESENQRQKLVSSIQQYRPQSTVFEMKSKAKSTSFQVMKEKRRVHSVTITKRRQKQSIELDKQIEHETEKEEDEQVMSTDFQIKQTFCEIVAPRYKRENLQATKSLEKTGFVDREFFIPYKSSDHNSERELGIDKRGFEQQATSAELDIIGDDAQLIQKQKGQMIWDRKRKKFIQQGSLNSNKKRLKTESGRYIPATYKTKLYQEWLEKNKVTNREEADNDDADANDPFEGGKIAGGHRKKLNKRWKGRGSNRNFVGSEKKQGEGKSGQTSSKVKPKHELKTKQEIFKERKRKHRIQNFQKHRCNVKIKRKNRELGRGKR